MADSRDTVTKQPQLDTYRAWQATRYGSAADALQLGELPYRAPSGTDVAIRVQAAALNPIDYKLLAGDLRRLHKLRFPATPGFDAAGTVIACGPGVTRFAPGERVFVRGSRDTLGAFAEISTQPEAFVAHAPRNLDATEAASLPLVALTTMQALVDRAEARAGQNILIHAGVGGLGSFAMQYARHLGLTVHTTCSERNRSLAFSLGAQEVIAYDREDYRHRLDRYDMVFDTLGGAHTLDSFKVVKRGGILVSVAGPPDREMAAKAPNFLVRWGMRAMAGEVHAAAKRKNVRYFRFLTESDGPRLETLVPLLESGEIRPLIDRTFEFDQLVAACEYLQQGRARGKVVLRVAGG